MKALLEYRETALRIQNEGLADRLYMGVTGLKNECGTAYCIMGWKSVWFGLPILDQSGRLNIGSAGYQHGWNWSQEVSTAASPIVDVWFIMFGPDQKSGPEGLQILINRINWFIRRKERWEAFSKLPDLPKAERWAEHARLAA